MAYLKCWITSALRPLNCSSQQSFTTRNKLQESKSEVKTFRKWFRQDLDLNLRVGPFLPFSRPFPPFSRPFPPFSVLWILCFSLFFLVQRCFFHDNQFCCMHFRCLLERCCKCQNATTNSSETAFCGAMTVSQTYSVTQKPCP